MSQHSTNYKDRGAFTVKGHIKISDPETGEVYIDKLNAIHYENMSVAMVQSLSNQGLGTIYQMDFGNGGTTVDPTGLITYLTPNTIGINSSLYNKTYAKIVDDNSVFNLDPTRNKMTVNHTQGKVYTDILVQCLLDYGEPSGQAAFDNSTQMTFNVINVFLEKGKRNFSVFIDLTIYANAISPRYRIKANI